MCNPYRRALVTVGLLLYSRTTRYYAPAPNRRGIKRCFCLTSDVCLSRTSGLSREQRGLGRLKFNGPEVAHVTSDSETTFKVKRSKVKVTRPLWLAVLAGQHGQRVSYRSI